jgi:hypothetical protein
MCSNGVWARANPRVMSNDRECWRKAEKLGFVSESRNFAWRRAVYSAKSGDCENSAQRPCPYMGIYFAAIYGHVPTYGLLSEVNQPVKAL